MADSEQSEKRKGAPETAGREAVGEGSLYAESTLRLGAIALVCLLAAILVGPGLRNFADVYRLNDIADSDVRAMKNFMALDASTTETKKREAFENVRSIYDFSPNALDSALLGIRQAFEHDLGLAEENTAETVARAVEKAWSLEISKGLAQKLTTDEAREELNALVADALDPYYRQGVVVNRDMLIRESERGITVRNTVTGVERQIVEPRNAVDYDIARRELSQNLRRQISTQRELAKAIAAEILRPNLVFNADLTLKRRQDAASAVKPELYQVLKGETLVREGDRITAEQERKLLAHAREVENSGASLFEYLMLFLSLFMFTSICLEFGRANIRKAKTAPKDLLFVASLSIAMLLLQRLDAILAAKLANGGAALLLAMPMAAVIISIRMVLNSETALVVAIPFLFAASVGAGLESGHFFPLAVGSLVGAHVAGQACRRVEFLKIGLFTGIAQAVATVILVAYQGNLAAPQSAMQVGGAFAGGLLCGLAALGIVPLAEMIFGYTTDMKLMELASLDHPLLKDLMIRAPGTYHHSMVTSTLVKAAAEAIGARAVLATVASYYHDIGKTSKAAYFIENQEAGKNPHDKLTPSMSALILHTHVREGVELAEKYKLGKDITDIIHQHHGTALIRYFYQKANETARPGIEEVRESEYHYPGPKPQTREAALVMLADAVEAAARTLPDPKPARIQGMVQNLINRIFADGQLDECDLALKDLHMIARSFTHILSGIHHQRIDYPLAAHKEKKDDGSTDQKRQSDGRNKRAEAGGEGEESLKRLGM